MAMRAEGDGPAGIGLEPPANLTDRQRLDHLSLYDLRNVIGLGVAGTDIPAFAGSSTNASAGTWPAMWPA